jgi:hypothetical protein
MERRRSQVRQRPSRPDANRRVAARKAAQVDWYASIFELIDMRSCCNHWLWIAQGGVWSSARPWVVGGAKDKVLRARRKPGQATADLEALTRVNIARMLYIGEVAGLWLLGIGCFILSTLAVLGFAYDVEFAQALFLLVFPTVIVGALSLRVAARIRAQGMHGEALFRALTRHRFWTQIIGVVAIFVTALWGMWQNMSIGVLGG